MIRKTKNIQIKVTEQMYNELKNKSESEGKRITEKIRDLIHEYIK